MKKLIFLFLSFLFILGCTSSSKKDLYKTTDYFVKSLATEYDSYGLMGNHFSKTTNDNLYVVMPIGRLIIVKINRYTENDKYERLKDDLKKYYKNDKRVHDVYICKNGTVVIDCRN